MDHLAAAAALRALTHALSPVRPYLDDPLTQEIEINSPHDVWVERAGVQAKVDVKISATELETAISVLARLANKDAKAGTIDGIIDARMEGFRVAAALPPTSVRGPSMCIRKHNPVHLQLQDYVEAGGLAPEWADRLRRMVCDRKNILVAGGTSSGKTTMVNALLATIPAEERIVTIEDTPELRVSSPNWVSFESNTQAGISTRDLVRLALRYRPDRVIVGEVRGGEAFDLLDAANTGHDGVIATLHASSSFDALSRFETLILRAGIDWPHRAICSQIAQTIDYVVFMGRRHGVRRLQEVLEVIEYDRDKYVTQKLFDAT